MKRVLQNRYIAWVMWPVFTGTVFFLGAYLAITGYGLLRMIGLMAESVSTLALLSISVAGFLLTLGLVVLFARFIAKDKLTLKYIGLNRGLRWKDIWLAVAGAVLYVLLSIMTLWAVSRVVPGFDLDQKQDLGFSQLFGVERLLGILLLVIVAPLVEEVIFRGILYGKLRALRMPIWLAISAVSALFALLHGQWNVAIDVFILSIVACCLREATGAIWAGILLHLMKNALAFHVLFVNVSPIAA